MGKQTPLYTQHQAAQGKIVDFGGWDMPLHYGSQLNEHHIVRQAAGVFDVSHMTVVDLTGQQVKDYLQHLLANDVAKLKNSGKALYSCMLNKDGGVIDDLIVYYLSEQHYRMVANAATRDKDMTWLKLHAEPFEVLVHERPELAMLAVQGPQAREKVQALLPSDLQDAAMNLKPFFACWNEQWFIGRTGYTGEDGFEIMLPQEAAASFWQRLLEVDIKPCGLGARDTLRLEAGMNLYGTDMDETISPLECGLTWTLALTPDTRDFIGREILLHKKEVADYLVMKGLVLLDKGVLRGHQKVIVDGLGEGITTSGTFSPTLQVGIALARLPQGDYDTVQVIVRNKALQAKVVQYPFVRHGQAAIDLAFLRK